MRWTLHGPVYNGSSPPDRCKKAFRFPPSFTRLLQTWFFSNDCASCSNNRLRTHGKRILETRIQEHFNTASYTDKCLQTWKILHGRVKPPGLLTRHVRSHCRVLRQSIMIPGWLYRSLGSGIGSWSQAKSILSFSSNIFLHGAKINKSRQQSEILMNDYQCKYALLS